jgi:hypothetical protein
LPPIGPSSNISFTSDISRTLKRLPRSRGNFTPGSGHTSLFDLHIARVSRPSSPVSHPTPWTGNNAEQEGTPTSSIFYLPPDDETLCLIDRYFADTGLLFPYIHEETFRETYAQLKTNHTVTRRTWLGVLNIVLALATLSTVLPIGDSEKRRVDAEAFYHRANALCAEHVMNGASLEIGAYHPSPAFPPYIQLTPPNVDSPIPSPRNAIHARNALLKPNLDDARPRRKSRLTTWSPLRRSLEAVPAC